MLVIEYAPLIGIVNGSSTRWSRPQIAAGCPKIDSRYIAIYIYIYYI